MIWKGSNVNCKWGKGTATDKVKDTFDCKISVIIKGTKVTAREDLAIKHCLFSRKTVLEF